MVLDHGETPGDDILFPYTVQDNPVGLGSLNQQDKIFLHNHNFFVSHMYHIPTESMYHVRTKYLPVGMETCAHTCSLHL